MENVVQTTNNYDQFKFIEANREQSRGHIEALKRAFESNGNLTRVQPILVNDRFEIIDGQHRFIACKELGAPINFTVVPGLGVSDARGINILHKSWTTDDYARSYANTGDRSYQKYIQLKEDFGFNHSVMLLYLQGTGDRNGVYKEFREGAFVLEPDQEIPAMERLQRLEEIAEFLPEAKEKTFARALLRVMQSENYDHKRMVRKLADRQSAIQRFRSIEDNLRQLEEAYNYKITEGNRVRLY